MEANVYIEGEFWATILIPGDSPLAFLAKAITDQVNAVRSPAGLEPANLDCITCTISLRTGQQLYAEPVTEEHIP